MEKILKELNPWWYSLDKLKNDKSISRNKYLTKLKKIITTKEILTISGLRRVGKSTLQFQLIKYLILEKKVNPMNILFFNIDILDPNQKQFEVLQKIKDEYLKLNQIEGKIYFFLDEIQNLDNWEKYIKVQYDLHQENIKFVLTGSNSKLLYSQISKLLTGRILNTQIFPLSFSEFLDFKGFKVKDLDVDKMNLFKFYKKYLQFGGFPEVVLEQDDDVKMMRLQEYFNSIILRDVLELNNVRDSKVTTELAKYFISQSSKQFSFNKVGKYLGISKTTVKEYFSFFENAFLFYELNKFDYSLKKQIMNEKKVYTSDMGLINASSFRFTEDTGRLLENLVFLELKRRGKQIYYHKDKYECDFVIKDGLNITCAIQVTKTLGDNLSDTRIREIRGMADAIKKYKLKEGLILTQDEEDIVEKDGKKIIIMPVWKWLLIENQ